MFDNEQQTSATVSSNRSHFLLSCIHRHSFGKSLLPVCFVFSYRHFRDWCLLIVGRLKCCSASSCSLTVLLLSEARGNGGRIQSVKSAEIRVIHASLPSDAQKRTSAVDLQQITAQAQPGFKFFRCYRTFAQRKESPEHTLLSVLSSSDKVVDVFAFVCMKHLEQRDNRTHSVRTYYFK